MINITNTALLIVILLFVAGCGDGLSDYQSEIIEKAESIIASDDVDALATREVYILLGLLYTECIKLKEYDNVGSSHDKLFTVFSNLIPTYQRLMSEEEEKLKDVEYEILIKTAEVIIDGSKEALAEHRDELEAKKRNMENYISEMVADREDMFNSLLRITTETQENPTWAKAKAREYLREFNDLIDNTEEVEE